MKIADDMERTYAVGMSQMVMTLFTSPWARRWAWESRAWVLFTMRVLWWVQGGGGWGSMWWHFRSRMWMWALRVARTR